MNLSTYSDLHSVRRWLAGLWGFICLLILIAPILAYYLFPILSSAAYLIFSGVCHQIPERSFWISGHPLAVCHRCTGVYLGLFLGSLMETFPVHRSPRHRRNWLIAAMAPLLLDALLPYIGLWQSNPFSRFATGLLLGAVASQIFTRGVVEFFHETSWGRILNSFYFKKGAL